MDDQRVNLTMQRKTWPAGFDASDVDALRTAVIRGLEEHVSLFGGPPSAMLVATPEAKVATEVRFDVGEEETAAAVFHAMASWRDAIRAFRHGEVHLSVEGEKRRCAAILEVEPRPQPGEEVWRASWRRIGTGEGGVGVFHGDWEHASGVGNHTLPEALREWLDPGNRSINFGPMKFENEPKPEPDVRMAPGTLGADPPTTADGVANMTGSMLDAEILAKGLDYLLLLVYRGRDFERWEVRGDLGCDADDFIRAVSGWSKPDSVAILYGTVGPFHGQQRRGVSTLAEAQGRRFERVLPLSFGPDGKPSPLSPLGRWHTVAPADLWIGVAPKAEVALYLPSGGPDVGDS